MNGYENLKMLDIKNKFDSAKDKVMGETKETVGKVR